MKNVRMVSSITLVCFGFVLACSSSSSSGVTQSASDASFADSARQDGSVSDVFSEVDTSVLLDGAKEASSAPEVQVIYGDSGTGTSCLFNLECAEGLRCQEPEFECLPGVRGTGALGVSSCTSGNDCFEAVCLETSGAYFCSGPCDTNADCAGALPRCLTIPNLGKVCAPLPPADGGL